MALQKNTSSKLSPRKAAPVSSLLAQDLIRQWVMNDYYVYMRPLDGKLIDSAQKGKVYWNVKVEIRGVPWKQFRGEGWDVNGVVRELAERIRTGKSDHQGSVKSSANGSQKSSPMKPSSASRKNTGRKIVRSK